MRAAVTALTVCSALGLSAAADDTKKEPVRRIDLAGFNLGREPMGSVDKPTEITTPEQLAKLFPTKEMQQKISSQVNFDTEKLLYFAWGGSGGDKLGFTVGKGKDGPAVTFNYTAGLTDDLRFHHHLFAVPRKAEWSIKK